MPRRSNKGLFVGLIVGGALLAAGCAALFFVFGWNGGAANQPVAPIQPIAPILPVAPRQPVAVNHPAPAPLVIDPRNMPSSIIFAHELAVQQMILNPGGTVLVSADQKGFKLWDPSEKNDKPLAAFTVKRSPVSAMAFTPDGLQLATAFGGDALDLRDGRTGNLLHVRAIHLTQGADATGAAIPDRRPTRCLAFSTNGKVLAVGRGGDVILWDVEAGKQVRLLKAGAETVQALAYSPDGKTLATGGGDKLVKLWDTDTWTERFVLHGHVKDVRALSFSPDGTRLASAASDQLPIVWDVAAGKKLGRLIGHTDAVLSIAYSPDGKLLATGSADGTLRLWDAQTFTERSPIHHLSKASGEAGAFHPVEAVAFHPKGEILFAASSGTIQLWDVQKLLGP